MANRLTKGKALIGSLDVQGALTVNGTPVGAGGNAIVFTQNADWLDPNFNMDYQKAKIFWQKMDPYFSRGEIYIQERVYEGATSTLRPFFAENGLQSGDILDVVGLTYVDMNYANPYRDWADFYYSAFTLTSGLCSYDMMSNALVLRFQFLMAGISGEWNTMPISELKFTKRG